MKYINLIKSAINKVLDRTIGLLEMAVLGIIVISTLSYALAWQAPGQTPPAGNVDTPINTGSTGQAKSGGLILNTGGAATGLIIQNGNVGIGTINPGQKLTVAGTIELTSGGVKFPDNTIQTTAVGGAFPSGTQIIFFQASCPSGWTQNISYNDRMIRIVGGGGGGIGGSWVINGLSSGAAGDHNHSIPAHTHSVPMDGWGTASQRTNGRLGTGSGVFNGSLATKGNTTGSGGGGTTGNAGTHTHPISQDGTWRPSYLDAIICQKN